MVKMNRKEVEIQEALGIVFICVGCEKTKIISDKSDGGIYEIDNFCKECLKVSGDFSDRLILSERRYKAGYTICEEFMDDRNYGGQGVFMNTAYTLSGDYIGNPKTAYFLCVKKGIVPELKSASSTICTIGYSEKDKKYYGWSHRALCGFAIGDKIFQERFGSDKTPFIKHGKKTIRTKADQRKAAIAFANSVS